MGRVSALVATIGIVAGLALLTSANPMPVISTNRHQKTDR